MPEKTINEDELIGYIMRKVKNNEDINLLYEDVRAILDAEMDFLKEKGIVESD